MADIWYRPSPDLGELFDPSGIDKTLEHLRMQIEAGDLQPGAQLSVYRHGRLAFDAGGGLARRGPTQLSVTPDTVFVLLSATKAWAATAAHMLVERGLLDYDARVADYWPEFAQHGKQAVTVRHLLSHRGGYPMPPWDESDPDTIVERSELQWEPGTTNAYHFSNFGDTIAGLVRRTDGRSIQDFVAEEIFRRVGMPNSFLGERADVGFPDDRVAWIYGMVPGTPGAEFPQPEAKLEPWHEEYAFIFNRPDVQRAGRASGNGLSNATDMARFYGALANDGLAEGMDPAAPLLRPATVDLATRRTNAPGEIDQYMQLEVAWGLGWHLGGRTTAGAGMGVTTGDETSFGHGGGACTLGWADRTLRIGCGYLTNGNLPWGDKAFARTGEIADLLRHAAR
jgi:CubicO group peptidase (beta-lactamase class C family)